MIRSEKIKRGARDDRYYIAGIDSRLACTSSLLKLFLKKKILAEREENRSF